MPSKSLGLVLVLAAGLALGACQKTAAIQGRQGDELLIATVAGEPLTLADVQAVQPAANSRSVDPAVLGQLIDRKLLAQAAKAEKLDEDAAVRREADAAVEVARANAKGRQIGDALPAPTDKEIDALMAAHPESFANRKFVVIEQIELAKPAKDIDIAPSATVKSLDQVQATLDEAGLPYQRIVVVVDTANTPVAVREKLLALPLNTLFQFSTATGMAEGQVLQVRAAPLGGPRAREIARNYLRNQSVGAAVDEATKAMRAKAKIKFEPGFAMP